MRRVLRKAGAVGGTERLVMSGEGGGVHAVSVGVGGWVVWLERLRARVDDGEAEVDPCACYCPIISLVTQMRSGKRSRT